MGNCCDGESLGETYLHIPLTAAGKRSSAITDLEETFKTWAWDNYLRSASRNKLKYSEAHIQLVWDRVRFKSKELVYNSEPSRSLPGPNQSQVAFTSRYQNDTGVPQTHAFRAEKTTTATITTHLAKGFSKEGSLGLELALPADVAKATIGFGLNYTVETADENTVARAMTWTTDTTVTSEPKSVTLAQLEVQEEESNWKFKVNVIIKGRITAQIRGMKGRAKISRTIDGDVATILADGREKDAGSIPKEVEINKGKVTWPVEGTCDFRFGVSQKVKVSSEKA